MTGEKICDHTSVGVLVHDQIGRLLLIERAKPPLGVAPPAGHIDDHGSAPQAALAEVHEETGLIIPPGALQETTIINRRFERPCGRIGGTHHYWTVYRTTVFNGFVTLSDEEARSGGWYTPGEIHALAYRTQEYEAGHIPNTYWELNPGLDPVWHGMLTELGLVALTGNGPASA